MPLYEYRCENCGDVFEVIQKFSDAPLAVHEKCGGKVERLVSAPAFQFKGSGWYVTDYAKGGNSSPGSAAGKKADGDGSSSSSGEKSGDKSSTPASTTSESKASKSSDTK